MEKKPAIRFKEFTDSWEQRKFGEIYSNIRNAFVGTATPYYVSDGHFYLESNNVKDGQINHNTEIFINDYFYQKQKDKWLHTGDIVMVQSGHVGHTAVIPEKLNNLAAHALIMFSNQMQIHNPYFINYQAQNNKFKNKIVNITTGNTIKHILASDMKNFIIDVTNIKEEDKIANLFEEIDNLITLHQRKYDKLVCIKKYMLEKMFPKNGSNVPEIRFKGFTDSWEQRKVCELVEFLRGRGLSWNDIKDDGKNECILYGNLYTDYGMVIKEVEYKTDVSKDAMVLSKFGDVLIPSSDTTPTGLARASSIDIADVILGGDINVLRPLKDNGDFISYSINANKSELVKRIKGTTVRHLNNSDIEDLEIKIPSSIEEQEKISSALINIDNLITLHQRKLEKLKNIKKSMLEKMFV